jgi:SAM-dependent methyltransferase
MYLFDQYPEFIDNDVRRNRGTTTVSSESLTKRCSVLLPSWSVKDKRILDLGHCLGAMGHWCLVKGATHYTGVDIQKDFCDTSIKLLSNHWDSSKFNVVQMDVVQFMKQQVQQGIQYDLVIASGILHGYINTVEFVELLSAISCKYIVIEATECEEDNTTPTISFKVYNMVSNIESYPYKGWSTIVGFNALRTIMGEYGFAMQSRVYPEKIVGVHDAYNDDIKLGQDKIQDRTSGIYGVPKRYMVRYEKRKYGGRKQSLEHNIVNNIQTYQKSYLNLSKLTVTKAPVWQFDDSVAKRFQQEATTNIPDYERVLDMCLDIAKRRMPSNATVIDVGSALGHTMSKFIHAGFVETFGVESSQAMIDNSSFPDNVTLSDNWPKSWRADFVMANWTLHFVNERKQYIQDIYDSLEPDGIFILSDKTPQTNNVKEMYYDFKRTNGVTDEYIYEKEEKLKGYMNLLPVEWYLDILQEIGFRNIQIINGRLGFITFYAEK